MFSRFLTTARLLKGGTKFFINNHTIKQNVICKRSSGHNTMDITPSNYGWKEFKNLLHLYLILGGIPALVINAIINIRANPELTEIPEGYEPRHWEYYKHPITRFMARYLYIPYDLDEEMAMALFENVSENQILKETERQVEAVMSFYNDHRTKFFQPFFAEYIRYGRDDSQYGYSYGQGMHNLRYDQAFDPESCPIPVEGYKSPDY